MGYGRVDVPHGLVENDSRAGVRYDCLDDLVTVDAFKEHRVPAPVPPPLLIQTDQDNWPIGAAAVLGPPDGSVVGVVYAGAVKPDLRAEQTLDTFPHRRLSKYFRVEIVNHASWTVL